MCTWSRSAAGGLARNTPALPAGRQIQQLRTKLAPGLHACKLSVCFFSRRQLQVLVARLAVKMPASEVLTTKLAARRLVRSFRSSVLETMRQTVRRITRLVILQRSAAPRPVLYTLVARASSFPRARASSLNLSVIACPLGRLLLVDFLQAPGVVGSSEELCCEDSRCPAMRSMTKIEKCNSLGEDSNMPVHCEL